jgi:hypothetical protein
MPESYRDIQKGQIVIAGGDTILDPTKKAATAYSWRRLDSQGIQVDGSGPMRNAVVDKNKLLADLRKKFPDDEFVGA